MTDKLLYSINKAAQKLDVGRTTMYELINGQRLHVVRIGKRGLRVAHAELERFIRDSQREA